MVKLIKLNFLTPLHAVCMNFCIKKRRWKDWNALLSMTFRKTA